MLGLAGALGEVGVDVEVWTGTDGPLLDELERAGITAGPVELMHSRADPRAAAHLANRVRAHRPDVVHWHGTRAAFYGAWTRNRSVYTAHGLAFRKEHERWRRLAFIGAEAVACRADAVVSVSRSDLDELIAKHLVSPARAFYVPNAVRTDRWGVLPDRTAARERLGVDGFVVGTTSRLVRQKGVDVALRALAGIDATFVVVGDGELGDELRALGEQLGVDVRWLGQRDDVGSILRALDVFVLSSRWEGEPISLLEAMAFGLPCVATDTAGARELLDGAGWLTPIDDAPALSAAIEQARRGDPHRLEAAERRASARSFTTMARRVAELYELVVAGELVDNLRP